MIILGRNKFILSFIIEYIKTKYLQGIYIAKFQINNCFENFTRQPVVFVTFFKNLPNIF